MNTQDKIKILYVDDEPNNLICFMAMFRFNYSIILAPTISKAYQYLNQNSDINIIIADQRMPEKTGAEFFEDIRVAFPLPVRILITAYSDIEAVIEAVNKGCIFRYVKKPWTEADILTAIDESYQFYETNSLLSVRNAELKAAYDELDKFAYSVTHDLRGPIRSVLGALEISKELETVDEMQEILSLMEIAMIKLDDFIKNIHEYYMLKKGIVFYEEINFTQFVNDLEGFFGMVIKNENISFKKRIHQDAPFQTDVVSMKIIVNNLLSNAFKYQRKNETNKFVLLDIAVADNKAVITVEDNGIGIYESHINKIFTLFYRATAEQSGSGFGLYNLKDALSKLNGTIEVTSKINEGSTFKVIIPGKINESK